MFLQLGEILKKNIKENPQQKNEAGLFRSAQIIYIANQIFGARAEAMSFRDGKLFLIPKNAPTAANLRLESKKIIRQINNKLGKDLVTRFYFR